MCEYDLTGEWAEMSAPWIREAREGRNPTRNGLLDGPMLDLCGSVEGLRVLDCGCGEGRFCRLLSRRGAMFVLGVDLCPSMIEAAKELPLRGVEYRVADAQDMSFLEDSTFDLAISYLNQCNLPDHRANSREVYRLLRGGGRFLVANLHPMRSAVGGWSLSESGEKEHVILDRYFDESERRWKIMGLPLTNFHRTLSTYMNEFIAAGFQVRSIVEPTVGPAGLMEYPELLDETRVPNFIIYDLFKP